MGKFILCTGVRTKTPYHFKLTNIKIYSMDELCYYLYHNIYTVTNDTFDIDLVQWLREEVEMVEVADKLETMIKGKNNIKDITVTILCSADYFTRWEIEDLIKIIDEINELPNIRRRKIKADNFLRYKKHHEALKEYEAILGDKDATIFTSQEFGNLLHNLAIVHIHTASLKTASLEFKQAYALNQNEESLKQYFFALKLGKFEEKFIEEVEYYGVEQDKIREYLMELEEILSGAEDLQEYKDIEKLPALKKEGKVTEYYYSIDTMIFNWKKNYKKGLKEI